MSNVEYRISNIENRYFSANYFRLTKGNLAVKMFLKNQNSSTIQCDVIQWHEEK